MIVHSTKAFCHFMNIFFYTTVKVEASSPFVFFICSFLFWTARRTDPAVLLRSITRFTPKKGKDRRHWVCVWGIGKAKALCNSRILPQ